MGQVIESVATTLLVLTAVFAYVFATMAIFFSVWGCVGYTLLKLPLKGLRLAWYRLRQHERLQFLRIQALQERLGRICDNQKFKSFLEICRNGWHPERDAARQVEREIDVENQKEALSKEELD